MSLALGAIADDFTGGTDLANTLARGGLRVVQTVGVPTSMPDDVDAVVVALKSRTAPVADAVRESLVALDALRSAGAKRFYFKVCSTFDSTPQGNIGPVALALADALGADFVPVTPAVPENGRRVFMGHLFVGDRLLGESPMRHHPLTPMTDADLVRVLAAQLTGESVGLIHHGQVSAGARALVKAAGVLRADGARFAIVDSVDEAALHTLGSAQVLAGWPLVVAGSGVALGLAPAMGFVPQRASTALPPPQGRAAIVAGSCSAQTNRQVAAHRATGAPIRAIDPIALASGADSTAAVLSWAGEQPDDAPLLIHATAAPEAVQAVQRQLGIAAAGALVEEALAQIACGLVARGVRRLVVAGGETSGAVVQALDIDRLRIGPQIDPGVPWCHAACRNGTALHLALKSGNFGGDDFFARAFRQLEASP